MSRVDTLLLGQLRISLIRYVLQVVTSFLSFGALFGGLMSLLRSKLLFGDYCEVLFLLDLHALSKKVSLPNSHYIFCNHWMVSDIHMFKECNAMEGF